MVLYIESADWLKATWHASQQVSQLHSCYNYECEIPVTKGALDFGDIWSYLLLPNTHSFGFESFVDQQYVHNPIPYSSNNSYLIEKKQSIYPKQNLKQSGIKLVSKQLDISRPM